MLLSLGSVVVSVPALLSVLEPCREVAAHFLLLQIKCGPQKTEEYSQREPNSCLVVWGTVSHPLLPEPPCTFQNADWETDSQRPALFKYTPVLHSLPMEWRPFMSHQCSNFFLTFSYLRELNCVIMVSSYFYLMDRVAKFFKLLN